MASLGQDSRIWRLSKNRQIIENHFPDLAQSGYTITSPATPDYNCIAWAAGDVEAWWEPSPDYYWPPGVPRRYTLPAYVQAYETLGYFPCQDPGYETGFERIAIYVDSTGKPTHAARQCNPEYWTSKLGKMEDIEHRNLDCLSGQLYGRIAAILKRPKPGL